jgi:F-type H+-transporting ATPase subunit epsilon
MADTLTLDLVSPERVLASEPVEMVTLPAADGDIGILPEHAPLLTLLRPGIITIWKGANPERRIFVSGGFAEINQSGCIVLADGVEPLEDIDRAAADQAVKDAQDDLGDAKEPSESEQKRLDDALKVALARVEALSEA